MRLALLNTSIITREGNYYFKKISLEEAKKLIAENKDNLDSAIGHLSTAKIISSLLGTDIKVNRQIFKQEKGQKALVFKLNGRPEEEKILSIEDIEKIGYNFYLLENLDKQKKLYKGCFSKEQQAQALLACREDWGKYWEDEGEHELDLWGSCTEGHVTWSANSNEYAEFLNDKNFVYIKNISYYMDDVYSAAYGEEDTKAEDIESLIDCNFLKDFEYEKEI